MLALVYRPLVAGRLDPGFLRSVGGGRPVYHFIFLLLVVVINLFACFQALVTLMAASLIYYSVSFVAGPSGAVWRFVKRPHFVG